MNSLGKYSLGNCFAGGQKLKIAYHIGFGIEVEFLGKFFSFAVDDYINLTKIINSYCNSDNQNCCNRNKDIIDYISVEIPTILDENEVLIVGKGKHTNELLKICGINYIDIIESYELDKYNGFDGIIFVSSFYYREEIKKTVYKKGYTRIFDLYDELLKNNSELEVPFYELL